MTREVLDDSLDPTTAYAAAVVDGALVTGLPVLWACQRHLEDLEHGEERGLWFDADLAERAYSFFRLLRFFEGDVAGEQWVLEPWQEFVMGSVLGWRRDNGTRRFREAWVEVAKKNGKSWMAAAIGNYMLVCDGESGAQIYTAATKRDQARIVHRAAIAQRDKCPDLRRRVAKLRDRLVVHETRSFFAPLGKDYDSEEGINPHCGILDEVHVHPDGGLWDLLESAMAAREQPLIFAVTTAGRGVATFGRNQHDYYRTLLDPESGVENDSAFAYIAELDLATAEDESGDDPYNELLWEKANPNLGISVSFDYMQRRAEKAQQHNRFEADFFAKNLNIWIQSERRWMSSERWDACGADIDTEALRRRPCFAGLDLSSNVDLTAFALFFPSGEFSCHVCDGKGLTGSDSSSRCERCEGKGKRHEKAAVLVWFWCPEENVGERLRRDRVDYSTWIRDGWIETTPGDWVDQDHIKARLLELRKKFTRIQKLALDMKFAAKLSVELESEGFEVLRFPQGYSAYCAPTLELERLVLSEGIEHDRNPVLRWNIGNVVLKEGSEGDVMPSKKKSAEKIDGAVATIMAIGVAGRYPVQKSRQPEHHTLSRRTGAPKRKIYEVFR